MLAAPALSEDRVRLIVREETADLRGDLSELKVRMTNFEDHFSRLETLFEDMQSKLDLVLELLSDALGKRSQSA